MCVKREERKTILSDPSSNGGAREKETPAGTTKSESDFIKIAVAER